MSPLATLIVGWCAVQLWLALYHAIGWARRPSRAEYLTLSLASCGFAVYGLGAAFLTDAASVSQGTTAMRLAHTGAAVAGGALTFFCFQLAGAGRGAWAKGAVAWSVAGACANLCGLYFDPARPTSPAKLALPYAHLYREPDLQAPALVWIVGACVLAGASMVLLSRKAREDRSLWAPVVALLITVAAVLHDFGLVVMGVRGAYLVEHATVVTGLLLSQLLLRRHLAEDEELVRRASELERQRAELEEARDGLTRTEHLATVGELAAVIAHEVRNPLAILKNATAGLRRGPDDVDRTTLLGILDEETGRLGQLVRDLLAYARPVLAKEEPIDVRGLIESALDVGRGGHEGIEAELHLEAGVERIVGDPEQLGRALANVVTNACQAMPRGERLEIRTRRATLAGDAALCISVTDGGEGMDTVVRAKALSPFFTTRPRGTGLGLPIVERVVRAHGGTLFIESSKGRGTTVEIVLPLAARARRPTPELGRP